MATLTDARGAIILLDSSHLVGRSRAMHTVIPVPEISAQHAALTWGGERWSIRDLGSRNGTWVAGERIEAGTDVPLQTGVSLCFGDPRHSFTLSSDVAPAPAAVAGERVVEGEDGLLSLPSNGEQWIGMEEERTRPLRHGEALTIDGCAWTLHLPEFLPRTRERTPVHHTIDEVSLDFGVSADDEYVEVHVQIAGVRHRLEPRTYHYTLLTLARARLADAEQSCSEQGWVYADRLMKMLRCSSNKLYVGIHRARKQVESLGVVGATNLVERRATTRQIRLGVERIEVRRL